MIAKKLIKKYFKNKVARIHELLDYITGQAELDGKVLYVEYHNLQSTEYDDVKDEMIELAEKAHKKCKNPVDHIVISFQEGEHPTQDQARECVEIMLKELLYEHCQYVFAAHGDTDNFHVHVAVNRVDPVTKRVHWNSFDIELMHKALAEIEQKQGWSHEKNSRYSIRDDGLEIVRRKNIESIDKMNVKVPERARESEIRTGERSAVRLCADIALPLLLNASSWPMVHESLAGQGFAYQPKGGGAILIAHVGEKEISVKPSDIHRKISLKHMQDRLGPFVPSTIEKVQARPAEPLEGLEPDAPQADNSMPDGMPGASAPVEAPAPALFVEFQTAKTEARNEARNIHAEHEQAKKQLQQERREILSLIEGTDWQGKALALAAFQKVASEYHKNEIVCLSERLADKMAKGKQVLDRVTDFETWVALNCPTSLQQVKFALEQAAASIIQEDTVHIREGIAEKQMEFIKFHNAVQADRYRISVRNEKTGQNFFFGYNKKEELQGFVPFEVARIKNIDKIDYYAKKGDEHTYFTPVSEKMHHALVDDLTAESLARMTADGFNPAVVLESSPGNFQAIVNVPKIDGVSEERNRSIGTKISAGLNKKYGDINLSGLLHPGRAPGFPNPKAKYVEKYGAAPVTKIIAAPGGACEKLVAFSMYLNEHFDYLESQAKVKVQGSKPHAPDTQTQAPEANEATAVAIYRVHRAEAIRLADLSEGEANLSRVDDMVALRLRGPGRNQAQVAAILAAGAPLGRGDAHDWPKYAEITAAHAFSEESMRKLEEYRRFIPQWQALERRALAEGQEQQAATAKSCPEEYGNGYENDGPTGMGTIAAAANRPRPPAAATRKPSTPRLR